MALLTHRSAREPSLRSRPWARLGVLALLALPSFLGWAELRAGPRQTASEREVRAVFLLHLARFVRWPEKTFAHPDAPIVIGVLQNNPLAEVLQEVVRDERVGTHPIESRVLRSAAEIAQCHVVFIGASAVRPAAPLIAALQQEPILLVSDAEGFLHLGGHIQFYSRAGEVKIRVAPANLKESHLTASSQLLRIARVE